MRKLFSRPITSRRVIIAVSLFWVVFANASFFRHVWEVYPVSWAEHFETLTLSLVLVSVNILILTLLTNRYIFKPVLILLLMVTSSVAYFMDAYDIIVDTHMITNVMETNVNESADLLSWKMSVYVFLLGLLPSWIVWRLNVHFMQLKKQFIQDLITVGASLAVALITVFAFSKFYTSFFREHKPLRFYAAPSFYMYSVGKKIADSFKHQYKGVEAIGMDAKGGTDTDGRRLVIVVVGEAARWDHFSLNGYSRETNPLIQKENIVNFTQFTSCGTETAVSVPCMFSSFGREGYDGEKAKHTENVLDVLKHAGVNVLWRDNNSDSKGVALRVDFEDYRTAKTNTVCDEECRDEGMLKGLQEYIDGHPKGDIVIVLHQMGNHGPAYYKRYPKSYEIFKPVCKTNQLEQCSQEEIRNGYDNAILYTDFFLSKVIGLLKQNDNSFQTAMFYLSDHGESLGEKGLYLHGFPYSIAPEAQKHVPAVMWFGKTFPVNREELSKRASSAYSQDYLFHTLLDIADVNTSVYKPDLDILHGLKP
ncbi:MAG: phosphoethanolamine transferase [Sulfuricurvum sp.]